jgi:dihydrolipoamide dehydrogenase
MADAYDLVVVGGGPGGFAAAMRGAQLRGAEGAPAKVVLVEEERLGGHCTHHACIPLQTLMAAARRMAAIRGAGQLGVQVAEPVLDMERLHCRKDRVIEGLRLGAEGLLADRGVTLLSGRGTLVARDVVQVGTSQIRARNVVVATGRSRGSICRA